MEKNPTGLCRLLLKCTPLCTTPIRRYPDLAIPPAFQHWVPRAHGTRRGSRLRKERGCMDIESGEVKLILDEDGHCIDVKKRTSGESEAMIEEFMLLANQCAAHFARVKQIPFVYRVHEEPNAEKLERLHGLLQACGVNDHFAKDVPTPKELSAILEGVRGTAYEQIINTGMLRCMSKAVYEEKPKGHYGLVLQDYAHFTSPIRRYPDLAIHRIMTAQLKGTDKDTMILRYSEFAEDVSKQASEREVIAMQIERRPRTATRPSMPAAIWASATRAASPA